MDTEAVTLIKTMPVNEPVEQDQGPSLRERVSTALRTNVRDPGVRTAAVAWKRAADRRTEARSDDALNALHEANRTYRDAMRDLRRDRRAFEKARDEVKWWNIFNGERRAARVVVRDSAALARDAKAVRREAQKAYPLSLPGLAARCHGVHLAVTGTWALVGSDLPLYLSVASVAGNVALAALGRKWAPHDATDDALEALQPSQEERDLLQRLSPKQWHRVAEPRGLDDVVSAGATLTESGIQAKLTFNGTMDLDTLTKKTAQLRAALRLKEGTRLELREGSTGGHARLTLRTRSAADGVSLKGWKPGVPWGVDTVTGKSIPVPLGRRMLVAGTSGSGKSWSVRPVLAESSELDDHRVIILDMKRIEARLWKKRARIGITPDEIQEVLGELVEEMYERLDMIPDGRDTVAISPGLPRLVVFVDEGSELISAAKKKYASIMEDLRTLARMGRAAEIILVWATQKPLLTGESPGLDSQIAAQITYRISLAVATQKEAMVIFGDDAIQEGWLANKLPMPGVAMVRDSNKALPHHVKMRALSPQDVMNLPARAVWSRQVSSTGATAQDIKARQALEAAGDPWAGKDVDADTLPLIKGKSVRVSAEDRDDQIMNELASDPCRTLSDLARSIGASKSVVKRRLEQMESDGIVCRDDEGCWHPVR